MGLWVACGRPARGFRVGVAAAGGGLIALTAMRGATAPFLVGSTCPRLELSSLWAFDGLF